MDLSDNTIEVFVLSILRQSEPGRDFLRNAIKNSTLTKRCIITIGEDGEFKIVPAPPAIVNSLVDSVFLHFVEQKKNDGFDYVSVEFLKIILECPIH